MYFRNRVIEQNDMKKKKRVGNDRIEDRIEDSKGEYRTEQEEGEENMIRIGGGKRAVQKELRREMTTNK